MNHSIALRACLRYPRCQRLRKQAIFGALLLGIFANTAEPRTPACQVVEGDRILMRDLAQLVPEFSVVAPDLPVGFSPKAGVTRVITPAELLRLAGVHRIAIGATAPVCFVRPVRTLDPQLILDTMRAALPDAEIELLDFSKAPVPLGQMEFSKSGLAQAPGTRPEDPVLWKGNVRQGTTLYPVWARVRVKVWRDVVVAKASLKPGEIITQGQVVAERRGLPPFYSDLVDRPESAVGSTAKNAVRAGEILRASLLKKPNHVTRGSRVHVRASAGTAELSFTAVAETSGHLGDVVLVRNPWSGRRFESRVEGVGKVVVE